MTPLHRSSGSLEPLPTKFEGQAAGKDLDAGTGALDRKPTMAVR